VARGRHGPRGHERRRVCTEREAVIAAEPPRETAELRCGERGDGIVVSDESPVCPMCRASAWLLPSGDSCIWK
jgi:hypothetical protein